MTVLEKLQRDLAEAKKNAKPLDKKDEEMIKHLQDKMASGVTEPVKVIDEKKRRAIKRLPRP
jgi:predicted RNase H-like nuclease (RuvC/YqgF family)